MCVLYAYQISIYRYGNYMYSCRKTYFLYYILPFIISKGLVLNIIMDSCCIFISFLIMQGLCLGPRVIRYIIFSIRWTLQWHV